MILKNIKLFNYNASIQIFNALLPIDSTYVQYPGQKSPNELWGEYSVWEELDYNGAFFRTSGNNADIFNKSLTVSVQDGTEITFSSSHGLSVGTILYDQEHNECRTITSILSDTKVIINNPFNNDVSLIIPSQIDSFLKHKHSISHGHNASTSTSMSVDTSSYAQWGDVGSVYGSGDYHINSYTYFGEYSISYFTRTFWDSWGISPSLSITNVSTSTSVGDCNGNTSDYGEDETRPQNFTKKIWKRIS